MATKPKKTKTKSSTRKKPAQKSRRKKSTKGATFKKNLLIVLGVFLMILMVIFGYFLGQHANANGQNSIVQSPKVYETESVKRHFEGLTQRESPKEKIAEETTTTKKPVPKKKIEEEKVVQKEAPAEVHIEKKSRLVEKVKLVERRDRPKLAIIIDDVSNRSQLNEIKATGLRVTPSIFPPSKLSGTSHRLAEGIQHYMIHLPMESGTAQFNTQSKTLLTTFSKKEIEERVRELRVLFPHAKYINNHTGSVFTDDYDAMQTLYMALRKEGFLFVDSRTIASTKVPQITKAFGDIYVARDVFIDNIHTVPYIHQQLQKAVKIAKKKGYAIAIGHPHSTTMEALTTAKEILQEVELVYIDQLYL